MFVVCKRRAERAGRAKDLMKRRNKLIREFCEKNSVCYRRGNFMRNNLKENVQVQPDTVSFGYNFFEILDTIFLKFKKVRNLVFDNFMFSHDHELKF